MPPPPGGRLPQGAANIPQREQWEGPFTNRSRTRQPVSDGNSYTMAFGEYVVGLDEALLGQGIVKLPDKLAWLGLVPVVCRPLGASPTRSTTRRPAMRRQLG